MCPAYARPRYHGLPCECGPEREPFQSTAADTGYSRTPANVVIGGRFV